MVQQAILMSLQMDIVLLTLRSRYFSSIQQPLRLCIHTVPWVAYQRNSKHPEGAADADGSCHAVDLGPRETHAKTRSCMLTVLMLLTSRNWDDALSLTTTMERQVGADALCLTTTLYLNIGLNLRRVQGSNGRTWLLLAKQQNSDNACFFDCFA